MNGDVVEAIAAETGLKRGGVTKTLNSLANVAMEKAKKGKFVNPSVCVNEMRRKPVMSEKISVVDFADNDKQCIAVS
eukprot:13678072-Heterocapsa_arctica.AAC.1